MTELTIIISAAAAGFAIHHWLKLPVIPLLVFAGIIISSVGLSPDTEELTIMIGLGLTFLMFSAGIELNPRRFAGEWNAVVWMAALQFIVLAVCGFFFALILGFDRTSAVYLGAALATSSTFVVIRQLRVRVGSLQSYGRLAIGVLLLQDVTIIIVIVVLTSLAGGPINVAGSLAEVALVGGLAYLGQHWIFPRLLKRWRIDDEILLLLFLAVLFVFAGIAYQLGLPFVVGAFFAGFSLSSFPVSGTARSVLTSLNSFFLAVFFTALGAVVELPGFALTLKALVFLLLVLLLTPPLLAALAEWKGGLTSRNALTCGLLLAQISEFSLVLGLYGLQMERIPPDVMAVIAIVAVATMTITPLVAADSVAERLLQFHPLRRRLKTETDLDGHVLVLGFGSEGRWVVKPLSAAGHHVVVVDHDPAVVEHLGEAGISCIRGDVTDEKILSRAGFTRAKLVLLSVPNALDAMRVLRIPRPPDLPVIVRVFEEEHVERIEKLGGKTVLNSHAAADSFMEWFEAEGG